MAFCGLVDIIEKETEVEQTKKAHHFNLLTFHSANNIGNTVNSANLCNMI